MRKLTATILCSLVCLSAHAGDWLGIAINTNGFTKTQSDTVAAALMVIQHDTAPADFLALRSIARDLPAQKYFYMMWTPQESLANFSGKSVVEVKAEMDAALADMGPVKNFVKVLTGVGVSGWQEAEEAAGYFRLPQPDEP